jgi:hypothetical protein
MNVGFYFLIFHFMLAKFSSRMDVDQFLSRKDLRETVIALEFYKQVHSQYPVDLKVMVSKDPGSAFNTFFLYDNSSSFPAGPLTFHHYLLAPDGKGYSLFDVGKDGLPGTTDDIYPDLSPEEIAHSGYRLPSAPIPTASPTK